MGVQNDSSAWGYNTTVQHGGTKRQFGMGYNDSSASGYKTTTVRHVGTKRQFDTGVNNDSSTWGYKMTACARTVHMCVFVANKSTNK